MEKNDQYYEKLNDVLADKFDKFKKAYIEKAGDDGIAEMQIAMAGDALRDFFMAGWLCCEREADCNAAERLANP